MTMLRSFIFPSSAIIALASSCSAGKCHYQCIALHLYSSMIAGLVTPRAAVPFDGQYIDVNSQNKATEWWWVQAGAPGKDGESPPSFHVTFYQGEPYRFRRPHYLPLSSDVRLPYLGFT